jgi:hypothetical protein
MLSVQLLAAYMLLVMQRGAVLLAACLSKGTLVLILCLVALLITSRAQLQHGGSNGSGSCQ